MPGSITRRQSLAFFASAPLIPFLNPVHPDPKATRARRMQWWHDAKFGMFVDWNLSSVSAPRPDAACAWAKLARQAGQKYMVMTTKHHEGYCLFHSQLTDYCAKQTCGRDLVQEFVEAARAEGRRVGFYYSLMDWHHPDGAKCATDEGARQRFVAYTHGQLRELLTNYGKIDILWYDVPWPLDAAGWESEKMNKMVFALQPDIIVNNRNRLDGDFATPEQTIAAQNHGGAWEGCMTLNDSWGYQHAGAEWKDAKTVVGDLITCAGSGGNYLLKLGPRSDGSIPAESIDILALVGKWMDRNGAVLRT